jgi:hypothetical protein
MHWSCCTSFPPKLKERDWKIRSTKVDAGILKHELLNRLWSILAVNVLKIHYVMPKLHIKIDSFIYTTTYYCIMYRMAGHMKLKAIGPSLGHTLIQHIQYWNNLWLHTVTCKQWGTIAFKFFGFMASFFENVFQCRIYHLNPCIIWSLNFMC